MIKGTTYDDQILKTEDFRMMIRRFFNNNDGIVEGCEISASGNNVIVGAGYFVVCGGYVRLTDNEVISAGSSGTKKLCFQIDLSQENTLTAFNQGEWAWVTGTPRQDDLFNGGTIYQLPFCEIVTNGSSVTSINNLISGILGDFASKQDKIITGTTAPNNADGRAEGTIYLQIN